MSFSNFSSYLSKKSCQSQSYCCVQGPSGEPGPQGPSGEVGPQGPSGNNWDIDISGTPPQIAYFQDPSSIWSTPDAEVHIATNQILFSGGSKALPVIACLDASASSTGIYWHSGGDYSGLGISSNGDHIAHFWEGTGATSIGFVAGINIGEASGSAPLAINRLSNGTGGGGGPSPNPKANWQDGHLGNPTRLYFTATDFMGSGGREQYLQDTSGAIICSTTGTHLVATKILPCGFKIGAGSNLCILSNAVAAPVIVQLGGTLSANELGASASTTIILSAAPTNTNTILTTSDRALYGCDGTDPGYQNVFVNLNLTPVLGGAIPAILGAWVEISRY